MACDDVLWNYEMSMSAFHIPEVVVQIDSVLISQCH